MSDKVRIYSHEHGHWWRENSSGYTDNIAEAGLYDRAEAEVICRGCGAEKRLEICEVVPGDVPPCPLCAPTREERDALAAAFDGIPPGYPLTEWVRKHALEILAARDTRIRADGRRTGLLEASAIVEAGIETAPVEMAIPAKVIAAQIRRLVDCHTSAKSLLRQPSDRPPAGCSCKPGRCMAPVVMGRQTPCLDPEKARATPEVSNG